MPKARRKKTPITTSAATARTNSSSTPQSSRTLIRQFHVLLKERAKHQNGHPQDAATVTALADIDRQIAALGGLESYQRMSAIGQGDDRGGGSEKILIGWLKEMGMAKRVVGKLKLLEVGALKHDNYRSCMSWLEATPMDLRSRHPAILEQDFLLMDQVEHHEKWDIISLSLVLNFVPEPKDRGLMLRCAHHILVPGGHLFVALPLPCVLNSRYLTLAHLRELMEAIGFIELKEKWKEGGKMAYWLYQKQERKQASLEPFARKTSFRQGDRNNFSILL